PATYDTTPIRVIKCAVMKINTLWRFGGSTFHSLLASTDCIILGESPHQTCRIATLELATDEVASLFKVIHDVSKVGFFNAFIILPQTNVQRPTSCHYAPALAAFAAVLMVFVIT